MNSAKEIEISDNVILKPTLLGLQYTKKDVEEREIIYPYKRVSPIPMALETRDILKLMNRINELNTLHRWDLVGLAAFLYLSGARISEALKVKQKDVIPREIGYELNVRTLKSRLYPVRRIPIAPIMSDEPFFKIFQEYFLNRKHDPEAYLFDFSSRFVVNNYFEKIMTEPILKLDFANKQWIEEPYHLHPHYFRHCRLSHLPVLFDYHELDLMKFAGWSSTKPCIFYVRLSYKNLLKRMVDAKLASELAKNLMAAKE